MMASFEDGLERAAQLIEASDPGLMGREFLQALASRVRKIEPPADRAVAVYSGVDAAFERFKEEYPDGPRNHWTPAKRAFVKAAKRYPIDTIIQGTMAFAASGKERQFIEAPAVFLNQDRFLTKYDMAAPNTKGASGLFALGDMLSH